MKIGKLTLLESAIGMPEKKESLATAESSQTFLQDLLTNDLICDIIFSCSSPAALVRFSRTCRTALAAVKAYVVHAFSINRHLSRFFDDVPAFRTLQARTSTLISGSSAVQFFDRSYYPESDLDLYVHMRWRRELGEWFIEHGYRFVANTKQDESFDVAVADPKILKRDNLYTMRGVATVFTFEKPMQGAPESALKVQLIIASHTPMEIILCFHSTCVMNIISYEKAYALYPRATFEGRRALVCATDGPRQEPAIEKYGTRGWEMVRELPEVERNAHNRDFRFGPRWISDSESWVIALDMAGVVPPPPPNAFSPPLSQDPVGAATWKLSYEGGGWMDFAIFTYPMLQYEYLIKDEELLHVLQLVLHYRKKILQPSKPWRSDTMIYLDESLLAISNTHLREQQRVGLRP
ncbi:hypothetical protein B0H21DRAFT_210856 [Amylocystis lapponica]|nr:hypothetical protein B0H21DRAFT_210856 [Amylocystis lapponica]